MHRYNFLKEESIRLANFKFNNPTDENFKFYIEYNRGQLVAFEYLKSNATYILK